VLGAFLVFQVKEAKRMIWLIISVFFLGILLAGCESHFFPWPNLTGVVMMGIVGLIASKKVL